MKRSFFSILGLMFLFGIFTGFSRVQDVVVTQDSTSITIPYDSLGWVEVNRKAPLIQYRRVAGQLVFWGSFGYFKNPSQEVYLQSLLNEKIKKAAKTRYGAEAVINVKYWPDLTAAKFPKGLIYAKGEMVRYKRFAE